MIKINVDMGNDGFSFGAVVERDGDKWCALIGENLQEGIAGFGDIVAESVSELKHRVRNQPPLPESPKVTS